MEQKEESRIKVKCSKCNSEIDELHEWDRTWEGYRFWIDGDSPQWSGLDSLTDASDVNEYQCPKCNEVLFTNEADAIKFLKGESVNGTNV